MKIERTKNAKRNIFYGGINKVATLLLPFFVRTIMIKKLGADYLGLNSLFSSILQVLNLADLGIGQAIVYSLYKPIALDDTKTIKALMNFYRKAYFAIGLFIFLVGLIITPFLPLLINGNPPSGVNVYIIYLLYLSNTSLSYFLFAYKQAILNALQRVDIITNANTITIGLMNLIQMVLLIIKPNYYIYIILLPSFTAIKNILLNIYCNRHYSEYAPEGKIDDGLRHQIRKQISGLMVNKVCDVSRNSFDSIFISSFISLSITAIYNNYFFIITAITGMLQIVTQAMLGGIGNSIAIESKEKNYQDMRKFNFIYLWISGWCSVCLLCLYQNFMYVWVGEKYIFPFSTMVLFVMYFYILKTGDIRSLYVDGSGIWWHTRLRAILEAVTNIILNYLLVQILGVKGIVLATLISLCSFNFFYGSYITFKYYFKNDKLPEYYLDNLKCFMVTTIAALVTYLFCNILNGNGVVQLIIRATICIILPNIVFFIFYRRTRIYRCSKEWLLNKYKK